MATSRTYLELLILEARASDTTELLKQSSFDARIVNTIDPSKKKVQNIGPLEMLKFTRNRQYRMRRLSLTPQLLHHVRSLQALKSKTMNDWNNFFKSTFENGL